MLTAPNNSSSAAPGGDLGAAEALVARHFLAQRERPETLGEIDIAHLDPALRTLLFTDGTVTRTLEVQTLSRVTVSVVDQGTVEPPDQAARYLGLMGAEECVERRVAMRAGDSEPAVWAESHIIPDRLPEGFLSLLGGTPEGIGESLQQLMLESARELLWFGLEAQPAWAGEPVAPAALKRLYRVTTRGQPALLIAEWFAVELDSGTYRLAWLSEASTEPAGPGRPGVGPR